jgi:hypothetical protein
MQLGPALPGADQLGYKQQLAIKGGHLHPHAGVYLQFVLLLAGGGELRLLRLLLHQPAE